MFDKFVANFLTSYLGRYISNIDKENVKVSFWKGDVVLENLKLRQNALRSFELPVLVKHGTIGLLKVYIPWTGLRSESVRVEVFDVNIVVHPKKAAQYDATQEEEDQYEMKLEALANYETVRQQEDEDAQKKKKAKVSSSSSPAAGGGDGSSQSQPQEEEDDSQVDEELAKDASFMSRLKGTMLNNVQITVRNVKITYEDVVTDPKRPIEMSVSLDAFSVRSCDEEGKPFFAPASDKFFYKMMLAEQVSVSVFERHRSSFADAIADAGDDEDADSQAHDDENGSEGSEDAGILHHVCPPFDVSLRAQHQPLPYSFQIPRWVMDVDCADVKLSINRRQWDTIWRSVRYVQKYEQIEAFREFRPNMPCYRKGSAREWWLFAINAVLFVIRKERKSKKFDWMAFVRLKREQGEYSELHKRRQKAEWMLPLTAAEQHRLVELEKSLPLAVCQRGRAFAYARLKLEEEQHKAKVEYVQRRQAVQRKKAGWWGTAVGWWSGGQKRDVLEEVEEEEEEEQDPEAEQAWGVIDSERWTEEQRKVLAKEFGLDDSDAAEEANPAIYNAAMAHSKTFKLNCVLPFFQVELLDYQGDSFTRFQCFQGRLQYDATEDSWNYHYSVDSYIVSDTSTIAGQQVSLKQASTAGPSPTSSSAAAGNASATILEVARDRIDASKHPVRPGIVASFGKVKRDDGVGFALFVEVQPCIARISVPLLQRCTAFWGVNTSLVAPKGNPTEFGDKVPLVSQLAMKRERQTVVDIQVTLLDFSLVVLDFDDATPTAPNAVVSSPSFGVPGSERGRRGENEEENEGEGNSNGPRAKQWISLNFPMFSITNEAAEDVQRNKRLSAVLAQTRMLAGDKATTATEASPARQAAYIPSPQLLASSSRRSGSSATGGSGSASSAVTGVEQDDWVKEHLVTVCGVSLDAFWDFGHSECRVIQEFDSVVALRQSLVKKNYAVPLFEVDMTVDQPIRMDSDRNGLFVMMSAVSLLAEFANNASGRETTAVESDYSRQATDIFGDGESMKYFKSIVQGPFPQFIHRNDRFKESFADNPPQFEQYSGQCEAIWRYVEVHRGELLLFHETRPSMVAARLDLTPETIEYQTTENILVLYLTQGGTPHRIREQWDSAEETLASYGVPLIKSSMPQQKAAAEIVRQRILSEANCNNKNSGNNNSDDSSTAGSPTRTPQSSAAMAASSKILEAVAILEQISEGNPYQCVTFHLEDSWDAERLKKTIQYYASCKKVIPAPPMKREEMSIEQQRQPWFVLKVSAPTFLWALTDEEGGVEVTSAATDVCFSFQIYSFNKKVVLDSSSFAQRTNVNGDALIGVARKSKEQLREQQRRADSDILMSDEDTEADRGATALCFRFETDTDAPSAMFLSIDSPVNVTICEDLVKTMELMWDTLSIMLMRHLGSQAYTGIPLNRFVQHQTLPTTLSFELSTTSTVLLKCLYGDEDRTPSFDMEGRDLLLRWNVSPSANTTEVQIAYPKLILQYPGHSERFDRFLTSEGVGTGGAPLGIDPTTLPPVGGLAYSQPLVTFSYKVLYKPAGLSDQLWRSSQYSFGFIYTHYLDMSIYGCTMCYRQTALWWLLEYFNNNPLMQRMSYLGWRKRYTLHTVPTRWKDMKLSPMVYNHQMLHQHIETFNCFLQLPHGPEEPLLLWVHCPYMLIYSDIRSRSSADKSGGDSGGGGGPVSTRDPSLSGIGGSASDLFSSEASSSNPSSPRGGAFPPTPRTPLASRRFADPMCGAEVQHGTVMELKGLTIFREGAESPVFYGVTMPKKILATGLTISFAIWFETASLRKLHSEKHLEMVIHEMFLTCSPADLALVLQWNCWCFQESWEGLYPPKEYPEKPFPILADEGTTFTTYDWVIQMHRLAIHLIALEDEAAPPPPPPPQQQHHQEGGEGSDSRRSGSQQQQQQQSQEQQEEEQFQEASPGEKGILVFDCAGAEITLLWRNDTSFTSTYKVHQAEGWDVGGGRCLTEVNKRFITNVAEIAHTRDRFLHMARLHVTYGWTSGEGKELFSDSTLEAVEVNVLPHSLFLLRDTLFSLEVRNGIAPMFKWPHLDVTKPPPPPPDKSLQAWTVRHDVHVKSFTWVIFANPTDATSQAILHCALQGLSVLSTADKFGENDRIAVNLQTIVCGVCDENRYVTPLVVPKNDLSSSSFGGSPSAVPPPVSGENYLLQLAYGSKTGTEGTLAYTWIMAPAAEWIKQFRTSVTHRSMSTLALLGQYAEERDGRGYRSSSAGAMKPKTVTKADGLSLRLTRPCVVVTEFKDTSRGVVASLGDVVVQRVIKPVVASPRSVSRRSTRTKATSSAGPSSSPPPSLAASASGSPVGSPTGTTPSSPVAHGAEETEEAFEEEYALTFHRANVTSLHHKGHYLLQPMSAALKGSRTIYGETSISVKIEALMIDIAQEYYESLLHGAVRHLVKDDTALLDQKLHDDEATFVETGALSESKHYPPQGEGSDSQHRGGLVGSTRSEGRGSSSGSPSRSQQTGSLRGGEHRTQTEREVKAMRQAKAALKKQASLHGETIKRQTMNVNVSWERFAMRVHSDRVAVVMRTGLVGIKVKSDDMIWLAESSVEKLELGVEGQRMLLTIANPEAPLSLATETDLITNVKTVEANLGTTSVHLSQSALVPAMTFLYEPYRRIVLPRYGVTDILRIDNHHTLSERLVLSSRKLMHCSSGTYNRIVIDCEGHEVHFISPGHTPVMMVDAGLTVEFINGRLHLYEADLENYVVCGNGGYVMVNEESNAIIRTEKPPEPTWQTHVPDGGTRYLIQSALCISLPEVDRGFTPTPFSPSPEPAGTPLTPPPAHLVPQSSSLFDKDPTPHKPAQAQMHQQYNTRALVLSATLDVMYESTVTNNIGNEKGRFLLHDVRADCLYYSSGGRKIAVSDTSNLVSSWDGEMEMLGETTADDSLSRVMKVSSKQDVDIRVRYGDLHLALNALNRARDALGEVESSMGVDVGSDETQISQQSKAVKNDVTALAVDLPRISFSVLDDTKGQVDTPIAYFDMSEISTPTFLMKAGETSLHIKVTFKLEYYNEEICLWAPLIEPVGMDIVLRQIKILTLQDLKHRKGELRAGIRLRALQLRLTPTAAQCAKRLLDLFSELSAASKASEKESAQAATAQAQGAAARSEHHQEFFMYTIQQKVAPDVTVSFAGPAISYDMIPAASDEKNEVPEGALSPATASPATAAAVAKTISEDKDEAIEPTPWTHPSLPLNEQISFNFPRIDGRELPVSRHEISVQTSETKGTVCVGTVGVRLGPRTLGQEMIVDVALRGGKKMVLIRSNVTFENKLPFSVCLEGVGEVRPGAKFALPAEAMRRRCVVCPLVKEPCLEASLGVHYESLQFLHDQIFLLRSTITDERSPQEAFYYFLTFAPKKVLRSKPLLIDAQGTFEPPLSIVNNTGVPIQVALYAKCMAPNSRSSLKFQSKFVFKHVATLPIDPQATCPVTELDPLESMYIDVIVHQPTGTTLTRSGKEAEGRPTLIHCHDLTMRESTVTVYDEYGQELILDVEYSERTVKLFCKYWIVNQTQQYLQVVDEKPKSNKLNVPLVAGQPRDGIPPISTPFLVNTSRHSKKEKASVYIRMGHYTSRGEFVWSSWSGKLDISTVSSLNIASCGETGEVRSFSYGIDFVGGVLKDTRVMTITPRWIVINRSHQCVSLFQETSLSDEVVTLPHQHSTTIDSAKVNAPNTLRLRYCDDEDIVNCEWSDEFIIDKLADYSLNLCYEPRHSPSRQEFSVVRVSCYSRGSILYVAIDRFTKPPYLVENRTRYIVAVKQLDSSRELIVYPRTTKGFVWENSQAPPIVNITAWEAITQNYAQATKDNYCTVYLDPKVIARRRYTLAQELILPGGIVLFVRVRGYGNSFALSVTTENAIDRCRTLPYPQISGKIQIDSINISAGNEKELVLVSVTGPRGQSALSLAAAQAQRGDEDVDEQRLEVRIGSLQVDDERKNVLHGVVLQSTPNKFSELIITRQMDRSTPVLGITGCELSVQPVQVHLEDSFLFEAMHLLNAFKKSFGVELRDTERHNFDTTPWLRELELSSLAETSYLWRIAYVEKLFIEQILLSISLYRGGDSKRDPIREQLGILSVMIRTVQDARLDWRRIENSELSDKLWLLLVFIGNYYVLELQHQIFNLVHIAGLDAMRNIVTDLLEGYFSPSTSHIDRNQRLIRRRAQLDNNGSGGGAMSPIKGQVPTEDALAEWDKIESHDHDQTPSLENCRCRWVERQRKKGVLPKQAVRIHEYAHHASFEEFLANCTLQEIRDFGDLAVANALRRRRLEGPHPKSNCKRCDFVDRLRARRAETGAMSLLPHPGTGELEWHEYAHHVSWSDFVSICSVNEVKEHGALVRDALLGQPYNVIRIEGEKTWCVKGDL